MMYLLEEGWWPVPVFQDSKGKFSHFVTGKNLLNLRNKSQIPELTFFSSPEPCIM
jgi:hypothetical protein